MRKIVKETNLYTIDEIKDFGRDVYRFAISEVVDRNEDDFLTNRLNEFEDRCAELMEMFKGSVDGYHYFGVERPFVSGVSIFEVSDRAIERYNGLFQYLFVSDDMIFGERNGGVLYVNDPSRILAESILKFGYVNEDNVEETIYNVLDNAIVTFVNEYYGTLRDNNRLEEYSRIRGFEFYEDGELYHYDD